MSEERLPTWDEVLAQPQAQEKLPTWEEVLKPSHPVLDFLGKLGVRTVHEGSGEDAYFTQGPHGRTLDAFSQGARSGWGADAFSFPGDEEFQKRLRQAGIFSEYDLAHRGMGDLAKTFNEALYRGTAYAYNAFNAAFGGVHEALVAKAEQGGPLGAAAGAGAAALEAFPAGHLTGLPTRVPLTPYRGTALIDRALQPLQEARDLKVIGAGGEKAWKGLPTPDEMAREALRPKAPEAPEPVGGMEGVPPAPPGAVELPELLVTPADRTPDIHARAREIAPDTFTKYDALDAQRETLRDWFTGRDLENQIDTLRAQRLEAPQAERRGLANEITELERQLAARRAGTDTPEMARVRKALLDTDIEMRNLAPEVSEAYRRAQAAEEAAAAAPEAAPPPAPEAVVPPTAEPVPPTPTAAPRVNIADDVSRQLVTAGRPLEEANAAAALVQAHYEVRASRLVGATAEDLYAAEAPAVRAGRGARAASEAARPALPEAPAVETITQADYRAMIRAAGDDMRVAADQLVARLERALAEGREVTLYAEGKTAVPIVAITRGMMQDAKGQRWGTLALATTRAERIEIRSPVRELAQVRRGSIRLADAAKNARATITLFKDADASTFLHETGHAWLEELVRDAADSRAVASVAQDLATVRKWVDAKEGEVFTTRQHEKFARGFERYVMEGVAPSRELANVFAKFKEWLTKIYQTVERLRSPITDDIRAVFDRMLAGEREAVVAPEREPAKGFAETHEADAVATPRARAAETADYIRGERDEVARGLAPELAAERTASVGRAAEEAGGDQARGGVVDRGGDAGQPQPTGPGIDTQPGAVGPGGAEAPALGPQRRPGGPDPRAGNEPFAAAESNYVDKAGNIRLDNLGTPEDVNTVIREAAAQGNDFIAARRGVISDAEVIDLAADLGMDAKTLDTRRLGEAWNAEQIVAARQLLVDSAIDVKNKAALVQGGTEADLLAYAEARARHMMIQEQVAGITAEAGRALRAFRAIEGAAEAKAIGTLLLDQTGLTLNQLRQEARTLNQLATPQAVSKTINLKRLPTWKDKVMETWIMGLLWGPPTHVANMVGNATVAVNSLLESGGAAMIGAGRAAVLGARAGERITAGEVAARTFGLVKGSQEGVIAAGKAIWDESAISQVPHTIEQRQLRAIGGLPGRIIRTPGRLLSAEDELFRAIAFREELNGLAYRQATSEGLAGSTFDARVADLVQNPTEAMTKAAIEHARYQTFTKPLGQVLGPLQGMLNSQHPGSVAAKVIVPFLRTPVNLAKYAVERTPFGLLSAEVRNNLLGRNGSIARDLQIARLTLGTAIATSIVGLAVSTDTFPTITGGGPKDPAKRAALMQLGWRPYSFKIGNFYYSYAWMDPLSTIMGVSADIAEAVKAGRAEDADLEKVSTMVVTNLSQNLMGKLSLRGTANLIQALTDPDRYGERFLQGIAGSIIPSAVGLAARIQDPAMREMRTVGDAIRARIPGLRENLHPQVDWTGQTVPNQGALGPDALSRVYISKITNDPVNIELNRLGKTPSKLDRKIRGVQLSDAQYEDYARTAGTMTKMQLDRLVSQPSFAQWPDFAKRQAVEHVVDGTREQARALMMMRYPVIMRTAVEVKKAEVHGATPEHVRAMQRNPVAAVAP